MTLIASGQATTNSSRQIVKDSSGNLIAMVQTSTSAVTPYISSDGGSTWTAGDTTLSSDSTTSYSSSIDGSDNIHMSTRSPSDNSIILYNQFTIGTGGTVTMNVTDETVFSDNRSVGDTSTTLNSTGTVYVTGQITNSVKGTNYDNLTLFRRDGADSWTDLGTFVGTGANNYDSPTASTDSVDDVHIVYGDVDGGNSLWNKWDSSASSYVGEETIVSSVFNGSLIVNSSDEAITVVGQNLWARTSGTWSSDQFTSDTVDTATISQDGSTIYVIYETGGDIRENHNTFGSFATSDVTDVVTNSNDLTNPTARWQFNNYSVSNTIDFIYFDSTNSDVYYDNIGVPITVSAAVASTASSAVDPTVTETQTLSGQCTLNGSAVSGAVIYVVNTSSDTVEAETTSDSNGDWSVDVPTGNTYHVAAQYDDGSTKYNEYSNPFLVT